MLAYPTVEQLRGMTGRIILEQRRIIVNRASSRSPEGSTFLSHSSADADLLPGVIKLLEDHGGIVYVDKKDPSLPPFTNRETALALRRRISQARRFIMFATRNTKDSRWVPWELGLSDGLKAQACTAILPGVDSAGDIAWTMQEYLGIYNRVVFGDLDGHSTQVWMVLNQERNVATELSAWLKS